MHAHIRHACLIAVAEAPATGVKELKTDQEYRSVLQEAAKTNALSVFDYTASWCGPCESLFVMPVHAGLQWSDQQSCNA